MSFNDLFSGHAALYASARPRYPEALFAYVAAIAPGRTRVWDCGCGCGSGQAALGLARHFDAVDASDASAEQIEHATPHARVHYSVQPAEHSRFAPASFDAVCVAQALHWFDLPAFGVELQRVLKPGGVLTAWGYVELQVAPDFDAAFERCWLDEIAPYWAPQNQLLWQGYRDVRLPLVPLPLPLPLPAPRLAIDVDWTLSELLRYAHSWSASQRCIAAQGNRFLEHATQVLQPLWGEAAHTRRVTMPLHLLAGRIAHSAAEGEQATAADAP